MAAAIQAKATGNHADHRSFPPVNRKKNLLRLQALSRRNITGLRILIAPGKFHWKYYAWRTSRKQFHILSGSSNLTRKGMDLDGEWMTLIKKTDR
jgi:hypothetical protein